MINCTWDDTIGYAWDDAAIADILAGLDDEYAAGCEHPYWRPLPMAEASQLGPVLERCPKCDATRYSDTPAA